MQISLKQPEIVAALTEYIARQGIDLANKEVNAVFTSGRKEGGLTVEITVEPLSFIPGLSDQEDEEEDQPIRNVVNLSAVETSPTVPVVSVDEVENQSAKVRQEEDPAPPKKTSSLFG